MQSYIFDFRKSPSFIQKMNKEFDMEEIETTCFSIVLLDDICDDNIKSCLNEDNKLRYSDSAMEAHSLSETCNLECTSVNDDLIVITLNGDVTFNLNDTDFRMKGTFLITSSGYVMGYSINTYSVNITNQMIFEDGLTFYEIEEGGNNG